MAIERVKVLLGCYANARPHDPRTYTAAIAAVLSDYPPEVVMAVTDPRSRDSLPRKSKWVPEVAEVAEACEALMVELRTERWRAHRRAAEEAEREAEAERRAELDQSRPVVMSKIAQWRAEVGPIERHRGWGSIARLIPHIVGSDQGKADTELMAHYGRRED